MKRKLTCIVLMLATVAGVKFISLNVAAQSVPVGQTTRATPTGEKTVGETFKNIQVLTDYKEAPARDLFKAMQFMSGSLSVSCNYCHVSQQGPFDSDANKIKLKAREMIKMTRAINGANFDGHQVVTCNTCHQGSPRPNGIPQPWYKTPEQIAGYNALVQPAGSRKPPVPPRGETVAELPDVDQVITTYRKAVGAIRLKSIRVIGTNSVAAGGSTRFQAYVDFPDKYLVGTSSNGSETNVILNADRGWRLTPKGATPLLSNDLTAAKTRFDSIFSPVKFERSADPRRVVGIEKIGDESFYVVESRTAAQTERLYFDVRSGLLYKQRVEIGTWLGTRVEETTFEDYRDVHGVKLAFLITNHYMEDEFIFKIMQIQTNVKVDPAKFELPAK